MKHFKNLKYTPETFSRVNTNPFNYYGEEVAFKLDIYEEESTRYTSNSYMDILIKNNIQRNEKTPVLNEFECLLVDYFNMDNLSTVLTDDIIAALEQFVIEYNEYWFRFGPILIYLLEAIKTDINNAYK